jgi:hypothetical protein
MSRIKGRDAQPELLVRSALHARGFRFRLHRRKLPERRLLEGRERGQGLPNMPAPLVSKLSRCGLSPALRRSLLLRRQFPSQQTALGPLICQTQFDEWCNVELAQMFCRQ